NRLRRGFRQSEISNLPRLHELRHRADGFLDRRIWINPMLVIQINCLDLETCQTFLAGLAHIGSLAVHADKTSIRISHIPKLRRKKNLRSPIRNRSPHKLLVVPDAIHIRGVEKRHAKLDRPMNDLDRLLHIARPIKLRHTHTTKTDRRNASAGFAERAGWDW